MGAEPEGVSAIQRLLMGWFPEWEPPVGTRDWLKCICPFHAESRASASVSYVHNAFTCHGCAMKGGIIDLIKRKEGLTFAEAVAYAGKVLDGSYVAVSRKPERKRSRRVFGRPRADGTKSRKIPPWSSK